MKFKFLLFGVGIGSNYGCDAIVIGTEHVLHRRFFDSEILFPNWSLRARDYGDVLGTNSGIIVKDAWRNIPYLSRHICEMCGLLNPKVVKIPITLVKQSDCVLSIGGDLYTFADKEKNWPFPYPIMEAGNDIIRLGKPYVIWCASVGPLEKAGNRLGAIVEHLKACRAIIVRERESFSYLRETIGLKENVYLAADPAFLMEPEPFEFPFLKEQSIYKLLAINFSLGPMQYVYGHMPVEKFQAELVLYVRKLLDKLPIRVLFVPHIPRGDDKFLTPIFETLSKLYSERVQILPENLGAPKTKWAVSQANALLTMRFHCALAGFSTSTPTIVLISTSKGAKICRDMYGNLDYGLNISNMNPDVVISKVKKLLDNEESVRKNLEPSCKMIQERALSAADVLANIL